MLYWNEYKQYKQMAERFLEIGESDNIDIELEILKLKVKQITKEQCIENLINVLSRGEHFKPLQ